MAEGGLLGWGRKVVATLCVGIAVIFAIVAGSAGAESTATACILSASAGGGECPPWPPVKVELGARVEPRKLPRGKTGPVALELQGNVSRRDGGHPLALREVILDFDRDVAVDARGLPACHVPGRDIRRAAERLSDDCRDAIVGKGSAAIEYAYPGRSPVHSRTDLTAYNGGTLDDVTRVFVVASARTPVREWIVIPIQIGRRPHLGLHVVMRVPPIADGAGSLVGLHLRIKRSFDYRARRHSYLAARCPDDEFRLNFPRLVFRNEAEAPDMPPMLVMKGIAAVPCTPHD